MWDAVVSVIVSTITVEAENAGRDFNQRAGGTASGLDQTNAVVVIGAEAVGEYATGCPCANDNVIVSLHG